ncbi:MAG: maltosaccharide-binding protein [Elusimicrobia bacterium]|nr:MAG: maltosaccharide-binding protein [Elusimicrobiota bacterium]KAF0158425.1 MAG: maltosaccharide-binding protein [Elusimicrobiota bacterium]
MNKIFVFAAALAAIFFLQACSRPADGSASLRTILVWEQEDAQVAPYIDSVLEAFRALPGNEDVEIIRSHYQPEDLRQQFQAASLAGVPPDLILSPSDAAGVYAVSGFISPLDGLFDFSRFNKAVVDAITLDGHVWGVPVSNGNHLMLFYNKKYSPEAPKNTDELFGFCREKAPAFRLDYCLAFDLGEPFWAMPWLGAFGGWPLDNKTPTLDTPAMTATINFYLDLKYAKKFVPSECDYNCMDSLFKEGKAAFIINGDWAISTYSNLLGKDLGVAVIPKLSATGRWPSPMVSGKYFLFSSEAPEEKLPLLKRFVEFYVSRPNQVRQYIELKRLPALKAAASAPEITRDPISRASMDQIEKGRPMPMATEMRAVWDTARNYMGLATTRKMSPEESARRMQQNVEKKISEMNR